MRIRFCLGDELGYDRQRIKVSSRHLTYIDADWAATNSQR